MGPCPSTLDMILFNWMVMFARTIIWKTMLIYICRHGISLKKLWLFKLSWPPSLWFFEIFLVPFFGTSISFWSSKFSSPLSNKELTNTALLRHNFRLKFRTLRIAFKVYTIPCIVCKIWTYIGPTTWAVECKIIMVRGNFN